MLKIFKKRCTAETIGVIVQKKWNGEQWFLAVGKMFYDTNGRRNKNGCPYQYLLCCKDPESVGCSAGQEDREAGSIWQAND